MPVRGGMRRFIVGTDFALERSKGGRFTRRRRSTLCQVILMTFITFILLRPGGADGDVDGRRLCHTGRQLDWSGLRGQLIAVDAPNKSVDGKFPKQFAYAKGRHCDRQPMLRFEGVDCELGTFEPPALMARLSGRRLVLWGDSVSRQMFEYIRARLEAFATANPRPPLPGPYDYPIPRGCRFENTKVKVAVSIMRRGGFLTSSGGRSFRTLSQACFARRESIDRHCFTYAAYNFKICYVSARDDVIAPHNVAIFQTLSASDIVLANIGLHRNTPSRLGMALRSFAQQLYIFKYHKFGLPTILWRTTSAQHFHGEKGGLWPDDPVRAAELQDVRAHVGGYSCEERPFEEMADFNWRNLIARELLSPLRIPVMDVWNITALHAAGHPQLLHDQTKADCTHWCANPGGLFEVWAQLLQDLVTVVLGSDA